ncbi:AAA family ATPase [Nodosilinea sp. LEGE 07298]|uniref:ATP-binding protein n=1 Tax=Nodosilinea sp. LEGE 07298 TaxID=2777970 RepID=UPI001881EE2B|nr:AAA family ATPase [Nodosilinea sp. LEGE 07298]MBE9108264.1 AAA family ATPase [Nodosilinea sp. LEGE 07298]
MKIITSNTQKILSSSLFGGGALAAVLGMTLMIQSPKTVDAATVSEIYGLGVENDGAVVTAHSKAAHAFGLMVSVLGCGGIVGGMALAERHPTSLAPSGLPLSRGKNTHPIAIEDLSENTLSELADNVAQLLAAAPWLKKMMGAFVVLVIGPSGSGKSTIAMAIAVLRAIYKREEAPIIIDPDTDANMIQGTWIFGDLYGSTSKGEGMNAVREKVLDTMGRIYEPFRTEAGKRRRTVIIDEVGKWETANYPELNGLSNSLIGWANQTARKQGWAPILILHGEAAGNAGGKSLNTGVFSALKTTAAVIRLEGTTDDDGELTWGEKATFKQAGTEYTDANFHPVALPDTVRPGALRNQLEELMLALGYTLNDDHTIRLDQGEHIDRLKKEIEGNFDRDDWIDTLNRAWVAPIEEQDIPDSETVELTPDYEVLHNHPITGDLFRYCLKKYGLHVPIEIRKVQQNWGKDYDRLTSSEIREIVNQLVTHHLAVWLEQGKRFALKFAPPVG